MSHGRSAPDCAHSASSWLLYNTERRAHSLSSIRIAENALREIRDSVRKVLEYSSESESEFPDHVIIERDFPIHPSDFSLIHINGETEFTNGHL